MATEFGRAVKRWRDRVTPQAAGLPAGGQRRAAGLRREELALLAGISVDYVTRLEQGRAASPSAQVVEALARALRLGGPERAHLYLLAGLAAPGRGTVPQHVTASVQRLLDRLDGTPVAVFDAVWTLITANRMWSALMGDWTLLRGDERNVIWRHFVEPSDQVAFSAEQASAFEDAMVADLHTAAARYPDDPRLTRMVADLRARNVRFATLWAAGAVGAHESAHKTVRNPRVGPLELDCDVLSVAGSDLRIVAYTAEPGSAAADGLALLAVIGTQALA
jgi:transcriptional regulator with XRE-family HTH domain